MKTDSTSEDALQALILASTEGDAEALIDTLSQAGLPGESCSSMTDLCRRIDAGSGLAIIAGEELDDDGRRKLEAALNRQPDWADFPVILMVARGGDLGAGWSFLQKSDAAAHTLILERPVFRAALLSAVRSALRSRRRQYQVRDELTERCRVEQALRESEERLRLAAEAAEFGAYDADYRSNTLYWSPETRRILHYPPDVPAPAPGKIPDCVHPDDVNAVKDVFRRAFNPEGDGQVDNEHRIITPDGKVRWLHLKGRVLFAGEGNKRRHVRSTGIIVDITDRKEKEQVIRNAQRFSEALNSVNATLHSSLDVNEIMHRLIHEGSAVLGSESAAVSLQKYGKWFVEYVKGLPAEDYIGAELVEEAEKHAFAAIKTKQPVVVSDAFNDERFNPEHLRNHNIKSVLVMPLIRRNETFGVIFFNYHADKHEFNEAEVQFARQLASTASIAFENSRLFAELQETGRKLQRAHDELEEKVKERTAELAESEERFRAALSNENIIVTHVDKELRYTWVHNSHPDFPPDKLIGKRDDEALGEKEAAEIMELKRRALETQRNVRGELLFQLSDSEKWYDFTAAPRMNAEGEPAGLTTAAIDITDRKRLETQLLEAQKLEAVGRLAGGIAHDFNNRTQVILTCAQKMLRKDDLDEMLQNNLKMIVEAGEKAAELTNQLLAFSRKQVMRIETINITNAVKDMLPMIGRLLSEEIKIKLYAPGNPLYVRADRSKLEQVLMNLAVNARDAMPRGGRLTITIRESGPKRLTKQTIPQNCVLLEVSDTGCGMDAEIASHVFEPFFTTKPEGEGTGLGLATTYGIIKQSGGEITVDSEPGCGTHFRIFLPLIEREEAIKTIEREEEEEEEEEEIRLSTLRILLVEDDAMIRYGLALELENQGMKIIQAGNYREAIEAAEKQDEPINLLITDMVLTDKDGSETAKGVLERHPNARILYISGYSESHIEKRSFNSSAGFLQKPFSVETLTAKIKEMLTKRGN